MDRVGDDQSGFSVAFEAERAAVRVRAWGFWNPEVASAFAKVVADACRHRPKGTVLALDMRELKPMREQGQESFGVLIAMLPSLGIQRVTVETASHLTKLQLLRIAAERGINSSIQFV